MTNINLAPITVYFGIALDTCVYEERIL